MSWWVGLVIAYLFIISATALVFSVRKLRTARHLLHDGLTAAQRYQARWRNRGAWLAIVISVCFLAVPVIVVADVLSPASFGVLWVIALSAGMTLFAFKQVDDDRSHDALAAMLERP